MCCLSLDPALVHCNPFLDPDLSQVELLPYFAASCSILPTSSLTPLWPHCKIIANEWSALQYCNWPLVAMRELHFAALAIAKIIFWGKFQDTTRSCGCTSPVNQSWVSNFKKYFYTCHDIVRVILRHSYIVKQPTKTKNWKPSKILLNGTNRSIQKPNPAFWGNFGIVKMFPAISFQKKVVF